MGRHINTILREDVDLGWATILGITNYRQDHNYYDEDNDATDLGVGPYAASAALGSVNIQAWQRSQELQILSPSSSSWQWIVGVYYINIDDGYLPEGQVLSPYVPATAQQTQTYSAIETDSYAGFAQVTVPLGIPDLRLTLGDRYTIDRKQFTSRQQFVNYSGMVLALPCPIQIETEDGISRRPRSRWTIESVRH